MARKRKTAATVEEIIPAPARPQLITETIEKNFCDIMNFLTEGE